MASKIQKHEVDRLFNILVVLGWTVKDEKYDDDGITLIIRRVLSAEVLKAAGEVEKKLVPF